MTAAVSELVEAAKDWATALPVPQLQHITEVRLREAIAAVEAEQSKRQFPDAANRLASSIVNTPNHARLQDTDWYQMALAVLREGKE